MTAADRDALAKLIWRWMDNNTDDYVENPDDPGTDVIKLADAILAAGWRAPEPPHRHQWAVGGFGTGVTGHPVAPRWSCACGAILYGTADAVDR